MKKTEIQPTNHEREFRLEELFFSTTDPKGIITSGNSVFTRISGYPLQDLLHQPHNIIRHPHMPRIIFKVLWDYLLAGKSIAAYVKNMARTGDFYWVVTLVSPLPDGFLSVRFKPSSPIFPIVQGLYAELLKIEQQCINSGGDWREGMQKAGDAIPPALKGLGFDDYDSFMSTMLRAELQSRENLLKARQVKTGTEVIVADWVDNEQTRTLRRIYQACEDVAKHLRGLFSRADTFVSLNEKLNKKSDFILDLAHDMRIHSLNASIESARLAEAGMTLGIIAHRMGESSDEIAEVVTKVQHRIHQLAELLKGILFNLSAANLQIEMVIYFIKELLQEQGQNTNGQNLPQMVQNLKISFAGAFVKVIEVLQTLHRDLIELMMETNELDKVVRTLHFIRINGKVETARAIGETNFSSILEMVSQQIDSARTEFDDLKASIEAIRAQVNDLPEIERRVQQAISLVSDEASSMGIPLASELVHGAVVADGLVDEEETEAQCESVVHENM